MEARPIKKLHRMISYRVGNVRSAVWLDVEGRPVLSSPERVWKDERGWHKSDLLSPQEAVLALECFKQAVDYYFREFFRDYSLEGKRSGAPMDVDLPTDDKMVKRYRPYNPEVDGDGDPDKDGEIPF